MAVRNVGVLAFSFLFAAGCTQLGASDLASDSVSISGVLSISNTASSFQKTLMMSRNGDSDIDALAVTDYTASCSTTSVPVLSGTAAVASDGAFGLTIAGANGKPLSCSLLNSDGTKAADFLIEDTSKKDLNGNSDKSSTITPRGNLSMSTITLNAATGEVIVPKSSVASSISTTVASSVSVFDPTGTWTIGAVDFTVPSGSRGPCTAAEQAAHTCNGPPDGQAIFLKMWTGVQTSDSSSVYGLQVWEGASAASSCGNRIGLTSAQKTDIGVDFSANGSADAEFAYPGTITYTDSILTAVATSTLTDGWKQSNATSRYDFNPNCGPVDITVGGTSYTNAWKCGPDASGDAQVSLVGGCTSNSTSKPVMVTDWTGFTGSSSTDSNGVRTDISAGTTTIDSVATAVTCTNKSVIVTDSTNAVQLAGNFDWSELGGGISQGTSCASIANGASADNLKMAQLRCYADYYWQSGLSSDRTSCMPRLQMDWSATTPTDFVKRDTRPNGLAIFEQYKPFPDGSGGSLTSRQEQFQGVQVSSDNWINCSVIETGALTIKKVNDSKLLVTYQSSTVTSSTLKPACMAKFTGKKETFMFYMTK